MRKITKILLLLLLTSLNHVVFAQSEVDETRLNLRGPIPPIDTQYGKYKTYEIILDLSPGLESSMNFRKIPFSIDKFYSKFNISGLKKVTEGEFKVKYNLTRYESVHDEDYVQTYFQKAPAFYIGLESNLEILDKTGKLIYKRYTTPKVNMYVVNPTDTYEALAYKILTDNFYSMIEEFEGFYLYGPKITGLRYFDIEKKKKSKSSFNAEEYNQSVQVLPTLVDVDREDWPTLFGEAQKYWEEFLTFEDKSDEDLAKKVRFSSNYNLAATYILTGQVDQASKYFEGVKENEKSFLGIRTNYPFLKQVVTDIDNYKKVTEKASTIEAIQEEPVLASYKKAPTAFRWAEFEGEVLDQDGKVFKGKVRIFSDYPEMIDYRTVETVSGLRSMMDGIGSEKSGVRIFIEGQKKPERTNLKRVVNMKDNEGRIYIVGKTGKGIGLTNGVSSKRYSLFEEIKNGSKISLFHEFFPQDDYVLKKHTEDNFFSPSVLIGRKNDLREYFADCPKMIENINKGNYDFENKETYVKLFDDYSKLCGN
ncbi:hypothetical protein ACRASX_05410 [Flavobacterium sp. TMP13]|uniref:hypothetical protein n=1 Tax=unclassified Flavobacterium TaxID=196869 RepID=UPI00076CC7D9|nr:hypothetical protein [Flavobacterium sp. TAB 87]KVV13557.1 hypothetical protein AP058_02922 [Flavobacterium sp. TAB 87]